MNKRHAAAALALLLIAPALAAAAKRPLNPKKRRLPAAAPAAAEQKRKLAGHWDAGIVEAIELLIETHGAGSPGYDANEPPVAVLPFTEGLADGDFAELVFWKQLRQGDFQVDDD